MFRETICCLCVRFPYLQGTAVRYRVLTIVLRIAAYWFFQNGEMRSRESNYMYFSFAKSTIKNQNTQLTEKTVGITIWISPDYPIEKSQYPINKSVGITQFTKISYLELWYAQNGYSQYVFANNKCM